MLSSGATAARRWRSCDRRSRRCRGSRHGASIWCCWERKPSQKTAALSVRYRSADLWFCCRACVSLPTLRYRLWLQIGSYQIALVAHALSKPVYVAVESFKFTRLFPLNQADMPGICIFICICNHYLVAVFVLLLARVCIFYCLLTSLLWRRTETARLSDAAPKLAPDTDTPLPAEGEVCVCTCAATTCGLF